MCVTKKAPTLFSLATGGDCVREFLPSYGFFTKALSPVVIIQLIVATPFRIYDLSCKDFAVKSAAEEQRSIAFSHKFIRSRITQHPNGASANKKHRQS